MLVATAVACGNVVLSKAPPTSAHTLADVVPAACKGLTRVHNGPASQITRPFIGSQTYLDFDAGAPYIMAVLDDHGLHFSGEGQVGVRQGIYNVCFVDQRSHGRAQDGAVFDFYSSIPWQSLFSVKAGTIGAANLCPGPGYAMVTSPGGAVIAPNTQYDVKYLIGGTCANPPVT